MVSLSPVHPCLSYREIEERILCIKVTARKSQNRAAAPSGMWDDKSSGFLSWDIAKILHEVTGNLTAYKRCRLKYRVCMEVSVKGQPYSVTRQPEDMNSIHRAESQTAPWHSTHTHRQLALSANKHGFAEHSVEGRWKFGTGLLNLLDSCVTKPSLEGLLPWEQQQSSHLYQTFLIHTAQT